MSLVHFAAITHPAAFFSAVWVAVRPVDKTAQVIPLVHAAHLNAIPQAERHAVGEIDIVRDQQRPATANIDDEALVTGTVVVITQQAADEARDFDPPPVIAFREVDISSP